MHSGFGINDQGILLSDNNLEISPDTLTAVNAGPGRARMTQLENHTAIDRSFQLALLACRLATVVVDS